MNENNHIQIELAELNSYLAGTGREQVYTVPAGYFEDLAGLVLKRIKALETDNASDEIATLSPALKALKGMNPYAVPAGYFESLESSSLSEDHLSSKEEIRQLSPLLNSIDRNGPYTVPAGYFENNKPQTKGKVISMFQARWFRMAVAAMIAGVFVLTGFYIFNGRITDKAPMAKFSRDVKKMDDAQKDNLIDFIDAGLTGKEQAKNNADIKTNEIRDLLHDIPESELKDFQEQTEDINDVLMTN
jgi:hypothetical protein